MAHRAQLIGTLHQNLPHTLRHDGPGQRRIGRSQTLGDGNQIGFHPVVGRAEHRAQTAKAGDDLIGHQKHVVFRQHGLDGGPVAFGWRHDTARAQDRFSDKGGDGIGAFGKDHFF